MNPEHFIYSHMPTEDRWQLLARRVTVDEFRELASLKPAFFRRRLGVVDCPRCVIEDAAGQATVTIGQPVDARYTFRCRLSRLGTDGSNTDRWENILYGCK